MHTTMDRVLVVATVERAQPILQALIKLGYDAKFFQYRQGLLYQNHLIRRIARNLPFFRLIKNRQIESINARLLEKVKKFRPRFVIATVADNIQPSTVFELRKQGVITINWFTDLFSHWAVISKIASSYDFFYSSDTAIVKKLVTEQKLNNCYYLPEAVSEIPEKLAGHYGNEKYPITFIGSYNPSVWQHRESLLSSVRYMGLNIWGPKNWGETSLKTLYRGMARGHDMFSIYQKSSIGVEIPWDDGVSSGMSMRVFEIMSAGICLFVYDIRSDMSRTFKKNIEYVPFHSEEEFKKLARYYLDHPREREKIAKAGLESVKNRHTFEARIRHIIQVALKTNNI